MGINLNLLKTVTKRSSNVVKQFVSDLEKGNVNVGDVWSSKAGSKNIYLRVLEGSENTILLDKHVGSKFLSQQTRFQFHPQTGKLMNTWRMEQSARGFIKQVGSTHSGIDYGMYENGIGKLHIMFDGNFKNPSNAVNMLTGEKVAPNVISDGLKAIRGEKSALNIHLDKSFI